MHLSSTVSTCKLLGNDRFVVNAVGKGSFPLAVGTVRNSAQDFLQAVAELGTYGPLSHGVVAAESGITRSRFGSGIRGKTTAATKRDHEAEVERHRIEFEEDKLVDTASIVCRP